MGTLIANAIGALLIGVLFVVITEKGIITESWRPLLVVGFLGALTTFSTFSLEAVGLLQQGEWPTAMVYILASVIICMLLTWAGIELARWY
jgi:CrcB protein